MLQSFFNSFFYLCFTLFVVLFQNKFGPQLLVAGENSYSFSSSPEPDPVNCESQLCPPNSICVECPVSLNVEICCQCLAGYQFSNLFCVPITPDPASLTKSGSPLSISTTPILSFSPSPWTLTTFIPNDTTPTVTTLTVTSISTTIPHSSSSSSIFPNSSLPTPTLSTSAQEPTLSTLDYSSVASSTSSPSADTTPTSTAASSSTPSFSSIPANSASESFPPGNSSLVTSHPSVAEFSGHDSTLMIVLVTVFSGLAALLLVLLGVCCFLRKRRVKSSKGESSIMNLSATQVLDIQHKRLPIA
eukprot:Sdes_comp18120_c1_seq1m7575